MYSLASSTVHFCVLELVTNLHVQVMARKLKVRSLYGGTGFAWHGQAMTHNSMATPEHKQSCIVGSKVGGQHFTGCEAAAREGGAQIGMGQTERAAMVVQSGGGGTMGATNSYSTLTSTSKRMMPQTAPVHSRASSTSHRVSLSLAVRAHLLPLGLLAVWLSIPLGCLPVSLLLLLLFLGSRSRGRLGRLRAGPLELGRLQRGLLVVCQGHEHLVIPHPV